MFKFEINEVKNVVHVTVEGLFSDEMAKSYINEYQSTLAKIVPSTYTLFVDGREQKVVDSTVFEDMQMAIDLYLSSGFKKVFIALPKSAVATLQIKRLNGYDKLTFVKTAEEAYELV